MITWLTPYQMAYLLGIPLPALYPHLAGIPRNYRCMHQDGSQPCIQYHIMAYAMIYTAISGRQRPQSPHKIARQQAYGRIGGPIIALRRTVCGYKAVHNR